MIPVNQSPELPANIDDPAAKLINQALANIRKGFAPPAAIYRAEYRSRVEWSRFPLWARSLDPEAFTGACHEG